MFGNNSRSKTNSPFQRRNKMLEDTHIPFRYPGQSAQELLGEIVVMIEENDQVALKASGFNDQLHLMHILKILKEKAGKETNDKRETAS